MSLHNNGVFGIMAGGVIIVDLQALNRNIQLHERLERAYDMVESLRERAYPGGQNLDGMPRGTDVSDKVGNLAIQIADLTARIEWLEEETEKGDEEIRKFANSFDDERLQMIIQARFISCFTWSDTADLLGPAFTEKGVKRLLYGAVCHGDA